MLLVCVSALGFILVLLFLDKAGDLSITSGTISTTRSTAVPGGGATGIRRTESPLTIRKATGDRFIPAPLPPPKELSSSGFWFWR